MGDVGRNSRGRRMGGAGDIPGVRPDKRWSSMVQTSQQRRFVDKIRVRGCLLAHAWG